MTHSINFRRKYVKLAGLATEVLGRNARSARPELQVVVFPGNPGNAAYYVPFMDALYEGLGGRVSVVGVSNLGQCSIGIAGKVFSLRQQIDHKLLFLREHVLGAGRPPCLLIGHSIGAYIALQNLQQLQESDANVEQIQKVVALMPFLQFDTASWRQWALVQLAAWPRLAGAMASAIALLPLPLLRRLVSLAGGGLEQHALDTTVAMSSYSQVANALHLAGHEFRDLDAPTDWPLLESLGKRVAVVCAPGDKWFPQWQWRELRRRLPGLQAVLEPRQRHGFCVSETLSRELAQTTLRLVDWPAAELRSDQRPATREQLTEPTHAAAAQQSVAQTPRREAERAAPQPQRRPPRLPANTA